MSIDVNRKAIYVRICLKEGTFMEQLVERDINNYIRENNSSIIIMNDEINREQLFTILKSSKCFLSSGIFLLTF